jgi:hypothetical protein
VNQHAPAKSELWRARACKRGGSMLPTPAGSNTSPICYRGRQARGHQNITFTRSDKISLSGISKSNAGKKGSSVTTIRAIRS